MKVYKTRTLLEGMKTWVIVVTFAVVVGILAFFILRENAFLSPALAADCESQFFSVDQSDIEFFGWGENGEPQMGDFISGRDCNTPNAQCLVKHGINPRDNSIYSVKPYGKFTTSDGKVVPQWRMGCSICKKSLGIVCECK